MSDLSNMMRLQAKQQSYDRQGPSFVDAAPANPFHPRFSGVVKEAFEHFDPGTLDAICCQMLAGDEQAAGDILRDYLIEVCQDSIAEQLEADAQDNWRY